MRLQSDTLRFFRAATTEGSLIFVRFALSGGGQTSSVPRAVLAPWIAEGMMSETGMLVSVATRQLTHMCQVYVSQTYGEPTGAQEESSRRNAAAFEVMRSWPYASF